MNAVTIDLTNIARILKDFARVLDACGQVRRAESYRVAMAAIDGKIATMIPLPHDDAMRTVTIRALILIPGIGVGIANKIYEAINTGEIAEMRAMMADPEVSAKVMFNDIVGVGPATAERWVMAGYRTIDDLRKAVADGIVTLTSMQTCGLSCFDDLRKPIPREDVADIGAILRGYILAHIPDAIFDIAGSYRRELPFSGDIDCLVTSPSGANNSLLAKIIADMTHDDMTHDDMPHDPYWNRSEHDGSVQEIYKNAHSIEYVCTLMNGDSRVSFVVKWRGIARQVDLLLVPYESYFAALTYFTGSYSFNETMRSVAKQRNMLLNQHGLWKLGATKKLIPTRSEQEVFVRVGIEWVLPRDRKSGQNVIRN